MDFCKLNYILLAYKTFWEIVFWLRDYCKHWAFGWENDWWIYYTCEQVMVGFGDK